MLSMATTCELPCCGEEVEPPLEGGRRCSRCRSTSYCGAEHLRRDWTRHRATCGLPYRVAQLPGVGRGLVASRALEQGELVISELPVLTVSGDRKVTRLINKFKELSEEKKSMLLGLSDQGEANTSFDHLCLEGDELKVARKFAANALSVGDGDMAVFEIISYINHSCAPNVLWVAGEDMMSTEVRTCRKVEKGEELVASYFRLDEFPLRQERLERIARERFFQCVCHLCSLDGDKLFEDEDLRTQIRKLSDDLNHQDASVAFKAAETKLTLMEKMEDSVEVLLPEVLLECHRLAVLAGEEEKAVRYRERGLALATLLGQEYAAGE